MTGPGGDYACSSCSPPAHTRMERFMEPCLLLLLCREPSHGYELMDKLRDFGFEGTSADMATLYRTLRQLEERGMVTSAWEKGRQGPPKPVYRLTEDGGTLLKEWALVLERNRSRIDRFLEAYYVSAGRRGKEGSNDI